MDERTWSNAIVNLYDYFRVASLPSKNQESRWFENVKHIPNHEVDQILNAIQNACDNIPRNIPKAFKEHRSQSGFKEIIVYNKDDDIRFPVELMHRAFHILYDQGYGPYQAFCDSVHMPRTDRDRVENKCRVVKSNEPQPKLPEIGHRVNTWKPRPAIAPIREEF